MSLFLHVVLVSVYHATEYFIFSYTWFNSTCEDITRTSQLNNNGNYATRHKQYLPILFESAMRVYPVFSGKLANYAIIICIRIDIYMKRFISFHQLSSIRDYQYKSIVSIYIDFYRSSMEVLGVTWRNEGSWWLIVEALSSHYSLATQQQSKYVCKKLIKVVRSRCQNKKSDKIVTKCKKFRVW